VQCEEKIYSNGLGPKILPLGLDLSLIWSIMQLWLHT